MNYEWDPKKAEPTAESTALRSMKQPRCFWTQWPCPLQTQMLTPTTSASGSFLKQTAVHHVRVFALGPLARRLSYLPAGCDPDHHCASCATR